MLYFSFKQWGWTLVATGLKVNVCCFDGDVREEDRGVFCCVDCMSWCGHRQLAVRNHYLFRTCSPTRLLNKYLNTVHGCVYESPMLNIMRLILFVRSKKIVLFAPKAGNIPSPTQWLLTFRKQDEEWKIPKQRENRMVFSSGMWGIFPSFPTGFQCSWSYWRSFLPLVHLEPKATFVWCSIGGKLGMDCWCRGRFYTTFSSFTGGRR